VCNFRQPYTDTDANGNKRSWTSATMRPHSSRTRERCRKYAIRGARTCRSHGSAAGHVRQAARLRVAALVDPALDVLLSTLKPRRRYVKPETQLRAAFDVLDRNGLIGDREVMSLPPTGPSSFASLTDEELETLVALLRKASILPPSC
jgi:hypothetical protein